MSWSSLFHLWTTKLSSKNKMIKEFCAEAPGKQDLKIDN